MTSDMEQRVSLLIHRHTQRVQRSFIDHLKRVLTVPMTNRALQSWDRAEEQQALTDTTRKLLQVMTSVVNQPLDPDGIPVVLVGTAEAAQLIDVPRRKMWDLSQHPRFPRPYAELTIGNVWLAADILTFDRAYRPAGGWGDMRRRTEKGAPE